MKNSQPRKSSSLSYGFGKPFTLLLIKVKYISIYAVKRISLTSVVFQVNTEHILNTRMYKNTKGEIRETYSCRYVM